MVAAHALHQNISSILHDDIGRRQRQDGRTHAPDSRQGLPTACEAAHPPRTTHPRIHGQEGCVVPAPWSASPARAPVPGTCLETRDDPAPAPISTADVVKQHPSRRVITRPSKPAADPQPGDQAHPPHASPRPHAVAGDHLPGAPEIHPDGKNLSLPTGPGDHGVFHLIKNLPRLVGHF